MAVPAAPTIRLTSTGAGSVRAQIDGAVAGATSYKLKRSSIADLSDEVTIHTGTDFTRPAWHFDASVVDETRYYYRAVATNANGDSDASATSTIDYHDNKQMNGHTRAKQINRAL